MAGSEAPRFGITVHSAYACNAAHTIGFIVEAATAMGARVPRIMIRHLLPNTLAALIVQGTYVMASAVLIEAGLSFLGAGTPPEIPSWGNIMAEARSYVRVAFWLLLFPGLFLAVTVLSINLVGDGLRDMLDPRIAKRMR